MTKLVSVAAVAALAGTALGQSTLNASDFAGAIQFAGSAEVNLDGSVARDADRLQNPLDVYNNTSDPFVPAAVLHGTDLGAAGDIVFDDILATDDALKGGVTQFRFQPAFLDLNTALTAIGSGTWSFTTATFVFAKDDGFGAPDFGTALQFVVDLDLNAIFGGGGLGPATVGDLGINLPGVAGTNLFRGDQLMWAGVTYSNNQFIGAFPTADNNVGQGFSWAPQDVGLPGFTADGIYSAVNGNVTFGDVGGTGGTNVGWTFTVPTPGAAAMLGLAGLAGIRRRR